MKKVLFITLLLCLLPNLVSAEGYYFHEDHLGGSSIVTNEEGEVVAEYNYMPYGELFDEVVYDEDFSNSYKFTDQEEDQETGLYYYGARYYSAGVGRFMGQDPAVYDERLLELLQDPQSLNAYAYVRNNPVKYVDPSGELPKWMWHQVIGVLDKIEYNFSASFLALSVQGNTESQNFYNNSDLSNAIRSTDMYKNALNDIYTSIDDGVYHGMFTGDDVALNGGDLYTALHGLDGGFGWRAVQQEDGGYQIYIVIRDTYDFDYHDHEYSNFILMGNNMAYEDQEEGDLSNYDIKIFMEEEYDPSD